MSMKKDSDVDVVNLAKLAETASATKEAKLNPEVMRSNENDRRSYHV